MNEFSTPYKKSNLPGIGSFSNELIGQINNARQRVGQHYKPRTRHLMPDGTAQFTNRLFLENSPYLLQHAHNPVNWFAWSDEAFILAKELGRPIFLSVGYSTCHWCHVMEEESFEDLKIAEYLNSNYICIKVDREERPDVDSLYMTAVQAITGHGGWPMSVWLTPERKPFYGGTYFPAHDGDRGQKYGFLTILENIIEVYRNDPTKVEHASTEIIHALQNTLSATSQNKIPDLEARQSVLINYAARFDYDYGGLLPAPKFPSSISIPLLLRENHHAPDHSILSMVIKTLDNIAAGGIRDHVGGGFHRYSTDPKWLVPHFEKMLYDNALLCVHYLDAYQVTKNENYKDVALEILDYISREMRSPQGGFYSATDADSLTSEGKRNEGYFFTWTKEDILKITDDNNYLHYYNVSEKGNFEGRNILYTDTSARLTTEIQLVNKLLRQERTNRSAPILDDKILTSWNALMISAFAKASFICNDDTLLQTGVNAANFILDHLYIDGQLYRSYKDGIAKQLAFIDDYAFFIQCLLDLFEASFDMRWLKMAIKLDSEVNQLYEDLEHGGFFMSSKQHDPLPIREKPAQDGALPSGNSIMVMNLLRLSHITSDDKYRTRAKNTLHVFSNLIERASSAVTDMLCALDFYHSKPKEIIIIVPEKEQESAEKFLSVLRNTYLPNRVMICVKEGDHNDSIPMLRDKIAIDGRVTAYVCEGGVCQLPVVDVGKFII